MQTVACPCNMSDCTRTTCIECVNVYYVYLSYDLDMLASDHPVIAARVGPSKEPGMNISSAMAGAYTPVILSQL